MKSFTISLPNKNLDNNGTVKNRLLKAIQEKLPFAKWHGLHCEENEDHSISYAGPHDRLGLSFDNQVYFYALNKRFFNPCKRCTGVLCPFAKERFNLNDYDGLTEFDLALRKINQYAEWLKKQEDPGYDFLYFGTPVRIYQNFIQIGNTILRLNDVNSTLNLMSEKKKENMINIIINISKTEIINNFE